MRAPRTRTVGATSIPRVVRRLVLASFAIVRFRESFAQMRRAERRRPFPDVPVSVASHGLPFALPDGPPAGFTSPVVERAWRNAQRKLAELTPDARHVIAKRSSPYVMFTQPKLVIDQVRRVVRAVPHEWGGR